MAFKGMQITSQQIKSVYKKFKGPPKLYKKNVKRDQVRVFPLYKSMLPQNIYVSSYTFTKL